MYIMFFITELIKGKLYANFFLDKIPKIVFELRYYGDKQHTYNEYCVLYGQVVPTY